VLVGGRPNQRRAPDSVASLAWLPDQQGRREGKPDEMTRLSVDLSYSARHQLSESILSARSVSPAHSTVQSSSRFPVHEEVCDLKGVAASRSGSPSVGRHQHQVRCAGGSFEQKLRGKGPGQRRVGQHVRVDPLLR
jgi:hypothetical protein